MPTLQFMGRILPPVFEISSEVGTRITWNDKDGRGLSVIFDTQIQNSVVYVKCELNRSDPNDLGRIVGMARDFVHASVDLISFSTGYSLRFVFETMIDSEGRLSSIANITPDLRPLCASFSFRDGSYAQVLQLVASDPSLFMALNDLVSSLESVHLLPINCARSIEGIRNSMAPTDMPTKQTWVYLRETLRVSENYLTMITDSSKGPRHGDRTTFISGATTSEISKRSWVLMNRFIEFRKRGSKPLPESEFPVLQ